MEVILTILLLCLIVLLVAVLGVRILDEEETVLVAISAVNGDALNASLSISMPAHADVGRHHLKFFSAC